MTAARLQLFTSNITIFLSHISALIHLISVVLYSVTHVIEAYVHGVVGTAPYSPTPLRGLDYWQNAAV